MPDVTPFSAVRESCRELRHQIGGMKPTPRNLVESLAAAVEAIDRLAAMCEAFEHSISRLCLDAIAAAKPGPSPAADGVTVYVRLSADEYRRLQRLADAISQQRRGGYGVQQILDELLGHVDQAISRPGSWQAAALGPVFGHDALTAAYNQTVAAGDMPD